MSLVYTFAYNNDYHITTVSYTYLCRAMSQQINAGVATCAL